MPAILVASHARISLPRIRTRSLEIASEPRATGSNITFSRIPKQETNSRVAIRSDLLGAVYVKAQDCRALLAQ